MLAGSTSSYQFRRVSSGRHLNQYYPPGPDGTFDDSGIGIGCVTPADDGVRGTGYLHAASAASQWVIRSSKLNGDNPSRCRRSAIILCTRGAAAIITGALPN